MSLAATRSSAAPVGMPPGQVYESLEKGVIDGAVVAERTDEITVDGVSRKVHVVGIMEFDGPLVSLWREYYDRAQLLRARGDVVT